MTRPSQSQPSSQELLERGRLTLQAIHFHERAARYSAAAASLQAAMVQAENGQAEKLQAWLELESHQFGCDMEGDLFDSTSKVRLLRQDGAHENASGKFPSQNDATPAPVADPPVAANVETIAPQVESPWERMERAANERLATTQTSSPTTLSFAEVTSTEIESVKESIDEDVFPAPASPKSLLDGSLISWASAKENGVLQSEQLSDEMRITLSDIDHRSDTHSTKHWWKAPHVWISVFVHVVLVISLSVMAITIASEPKILSIVSASVEAENVLLETPMEMISELESTSEPLQSAPTPNSSDLSKDITLPSIPLEVGSLPSSPQSLSAALSGAASDSAQALMAGSKMLTGAEFFGVKATGNTFIYIVDSSPSMRRDGAFDAARNEIIRSLKSMKPKQRYFVSFFGKEIDPMVLETGTVEKYPIYAKPENLTKTIDWLSLVRIQKEGLPPNNALAEAIDMQPDGIFLLFDGDTKVDVAKFLRRVNRTDDILNSGTPKVPIHVVHFYQDEFQKQMRQVAEENGGTYRFVPRPERPSKK